MSDHEFKPTAERPVRDHPAPTRSVVISWPADGSGLEAALAVLLPEAARLGVEVVLATAHAQADALTLTHPVARIPVAADDGDAARRRAGLTRADGDLVAFVTERTPVEKGWLTAWFGRAPGGAR